LGTDQVGTAALGCPPLRPHRRGPCRWFVSGYASGIP